MNTFVVKSQPHPTKKEQRYVWVFDSGDISGTICIEVCCAEGSNTLAWLSKEDAEALAMDLLKRCGKVGYAGSPPDAPADGRAVTFLKAAKALCDPHVESDRLVCTLIDEALESLE